MQYVVARERMEGDHELDYYTGVRGGWTSHLHLAVPVATTVPINMVAGFFYFLKPATLVLVEDEEEQDGD